MKNIFFLIAFIILISINSYVALRGWQTLPPNSPFRSIYITGVITLFLVLTGTMLFGEYMPLKIAKTFSFVGFTYIIVFVYLMLSFLMVDVVRIANYFFHFFPSGMATIRLWTFTGTLIITSIALMAGNYKFNHPSVVTLNIVAEKPIQNKELKIVAVSDLHLGFSIDKKRMQSYVKLINDQHPDIVLMVGDISDRSLIPLVNQHMEEEFRSIKAHLGVFAINGNHEHYAEKHNGTANLLKSAGINVINDKSVLIENSLYIVGRDDRTNLNRKDLSELVKGLDKKLPVILLDHQPHHLEEAENNGIDFQISGHTHNGQFFPGSLFVKNMFEVGYGYLKKGKTHYYVSSGLGIWGPQYRIGTQSELVVVNFKY